MRDGEPMSVVVVIPVFNGVRTLRRAINSVLAQTVDANVAILCLDDCSTDGSLNLLADLAGEVPGLRVHANPTNIGVSATRNLAISMTTQQFVSFLDQDDEWLPDKLERQLAVFAERADVGYVVGRQRFVLDSDEVRPAWVRPEWFDEPQAGYLPSALIVRRSTFDAIGVFDEGMRIGGDDTDWFARARRQGVPFVHLEEPVLTRHVHGRNLSSDPGTSDELLALVRRHVTAKRIPS
jgi:glycosyltransferase involved in cell wall biosynthesis